MNKVIKEDIENIIANLYELEAFRGKTVLISGANGFLPAYMVETLLSLNALKKNFNVKVVALVRNYDKAKKRFSEYIGDEHLSFIVQDVCYPVKITAEINYIIHAASQASPKYYGIDPVGTLKANLLGTMNMLNLAIEQPIESFLYFSSGEVYGQVTDDHNPVREDYYGYLDPMQVRACYGESKRMGENICVSYFHQFGVKTKIVRPFHTYGPGMLLTDGRVYADFVSDVVNGNNIKMKSDGSAKRAFCYLKDATKAFFQVLLKGVSGQAYNVGNPAEEYSILELAEIISKLGEKPVMVQKVKEEGNYLKSPINRNTPDINKIRSIGWIPETTAREGFLKTIKSFCC